MEAVFDSDKLLRRERMSLLGKTLFTLGATRGAMQGDAANWARATYGAHGDEIASVLRGAVATKALGLKAAVGMTPASDDEAFSDYASTASAFLASVADEFVGARIGARPIGFKRSALTSAVALSASWVGAGRAKPATATQFAGIALEPTKVAGLIVVPMDAFVTARADIERGLVADLQNAVVHRLNATFGSADAPTADAPGGIAYGATAVASTGATVAAISADIGSMIDVIVDAGIALSGCSWIASERGAAYLRTMKIADDAGTLAGRPLYSGGSGLVLVSGQHVALAMGNVIISRSEHGTIEMSDDPESDTGTVVSLFQANAVALLVDVFCNWTLFGASDSDGAKAAVTLTGATWV